tara:strand:+ start:14 stop:637 length:624 start_codon:yes stop_codon:yes gene_type:complete
MTIIDFLQNTNFVKFIEPYLWEFHFVSHLTHAFQQYLHTPRESICSIDYLRKNLYNSDILNVAYQQVQTENAVMLKLPQNTYCFDKGSGRQNDITNNNDEHPYPCKEIKFELITNWCNAPLLFAQFIEIVKAKDAKRLPEDIILDKPFGKYNDKFCTDDGATCEYRYLNERLNVFGSSYIYLYNRKQFYNKEIYYNMINLFNFYNNL